MEGFSVKVVRLLLFALFIICSASCFRGGNQSNQSFSSAKRILLQKVYFDHPITFYCGSTFNADKRVFHTGGYVPETNNKRANRLEWQHIVPASVFGQQLEEWREGAPECVNSNGKPYKGRRCAENASETFRYMQADMHNLVPAIGELSELRSNYSFDMIPGEEKRFGSCDMEIVNRKVEPPENVRGNIARIYFYMDDAYPGRGVISKKSRKLFATWDKQDPVDKWECEKERRVRAIQGSENFFVSRKCLNGYGGSFWLPL